MEREERARPWQIKIPQKFIQSRPFPRKMHFPERKGFPEDAQKGGEQDIATKTPTVHSNNPPTLNKFAKQLFLVAFPAHNSNGILQQYFIPPTLLFFSLSFFFPLNFLERIINAWNFRKSFKSRTNRRQGTLLLSPLTRRNSLEEIFHRFSNARRRTCEWIGNRNAIFARADRGMKRDWCRLSGTRLISSLSSPRMLIFLPSPPPRFSFVLCPFFVHRHVDLVENEKHLSGVLGWCIDYVVEKEYLKKKKKKGSARLWTI